MTNREKFEDIFGFTPNEEISTHKSWVSLYSYTTENNPEWWDEEYKVCEVKSKEKPSHAEKFEEVFGFKPFIWGCPTKTCKECFILDRRGCGTGLNEAIFWKMPYVKASIELRRKIFPCYICNSSTYFCDNREDTICRYAECLMDDLWNERIAKGQMKAPLKTFDPFDISQLTERQLKSIKENSSSLW